MNAPALPTCEWCGEPAPELYEPLDGGAPCCGACFDADMRARDEDEPIADSAWTLGVSEVRR